MSLPINIDAIKALSVPERILIVEEIWDSIAAEPEAIPVTQEQIEELDRRIDVTDASPGAGTTWEELKARIQGRECVPNFVPNCDIKYRMSQGDEVEAE